jgi:hypothetical protein
MVLGYKVSTKAIRSVLEEDQELEVESSQSERPGEKERISQTTKRDRSRYSGLLPWS